ncbi:glutamine-hydrolyzing GMP synthase [Portibacter marinus]|uniref:glutamine-hydrolyzing GMP synthase n=1 Tax=Portibacter marinus TaxID=2898660 RepID=UPI001F1CECC4|nr:glutamine-hydrolyzing GMP synthase [Portibacter marinus]
MTAKIIILDFGSQYTQLIARRLRELNVYCEIQPFSNTIKLDPSIKGIILSGSPFSVKDENALQIDLDQFIGKVPVLGVCYGAQYIAQNLGGDVLKSDHREYGKAMMSIDQTNDPLLNGLKRETQVWMSHGDTIKALPESFEIIAHTASIPVAAYRSIEGVYEHPVYCIQFHPEVTHSLEGKELLFNFVRNICQCQGDWTPASYVDQSISELRDKIGDDGVVLGLSGGVDSSVAAMLLHKAIGDQLKCIFIDNGLLRKNEFEQVLSSYEGLGLNVKGVRANDAFLDQLAGVSDPETKRKIIGRVFIEVFEKEAKALDNIKWLGQGTIYPDVIESVSVHGPSVTIKSHHNVGGLPEKLDLKIVEPLRMLFKDEVRRVGAELSLPQYILSRHPFPGPGLAIRVLGEISKEKVRLCQESDDIYISILRETGWYDKVWQAGAILLPVQSVGVMGDERTYEYTIALRSVNSVDGMTAEWSRLPHEILARISSEIINKVKGINRVVYDISTKPPATIEWE